MLFVDYLEPEEHVHESQPTSGVSQGQPCSIPEESYMEIPVNALDNPEYFDGPLGGVCISRGEGQGGKPLPPDPRTNLNLNNNIEVDHGNFKNSKEAVEDAPRLRKVALGGNSDENTDSYINTDYDHLGNRSEQAPFTYINPRTESTV